jgi:16S rRNA (guanine527-N7)-methyltransferase
MIKIITKYFPELTDLQKERFTDLFDIYKEWNEKINVISRKDIDNLYLHHILHSLSIAKIVQFKSGTKIMDVGTGGGFPGIPLAILFEDSNFTLVDSIGKKITVVKEVASSLNLKNVTALNCRVETIDSKFDFIVSRAVTNLPDFYFWTKNKVEKENINSIGNGLLYLKGGDVKQEVSQIKKKISIYELPNYFEEEFFVTKKVVHIYGF